MYIIGWFGGVSVLYLKKSSIFFQNFSPPNRSCFCNYTRTGDVLQLYDNDTLTRQGLVRELLQEHGQAMTTGVISACVNALPVYMMADAAEILHELVITDKAVR